MFHTFSAEINYFITNFIVNFVFINYLNNHYSFNIFMYD